MEIERPHRSYMETLFSCRCPRCRQGKLFRYPFTFHFKRNMEMYDACPVCKQQTDIEVGFYYGTGYVSYFLTVFLSVVSFALWWLLIGISIYDNRVFYWLTINSVVLIATQPLLMRFSRSLWLSWFVKYDPNWESEKAKDPERIIKEEMGNW